ncbi:retrovirus-related pol polyprotein from transposon TNT 1-94 [Tanacetum coccineum]
MCASLRRLFMEAPRACYDFLSSFLLSQKFSKGTVDPTLFIRRKDKDILLIHIYVDDIIFASTKPDLCEKNSEITCLKFKMSMMGKMTFFLGLQISQSLRGIFLNQSKYSLEIIKKYGMETSDQVDTPMDSCITLIAFADADHAGCQDTRRSTSESYECEDFAPGKTFESSYQNILCTAITKVPLLYVATTSNILDPNILTSDTTSSKSKWKMRWLNCILSEQNISWQISLPRHWDENELTFLSTSLE